MPSKVFQQPLTRQNLASEELARSTEKQLQAVEVLNDAVKRLQMDAEDLDTSVSIFKVQ